MTCLTCALNNCPEEVVALAYVGAAVVYMLLAAVVLVFILALIKKDWSNLNGDEKFAAILLALFFPFSIPVALGLEVVYIIARLLYNIWNCATKEDLRVVEVKLSAKIEAATKKPEKKVEVKTAFKVGELVVGKKGNPGNHKHLNEGSVSRVLSINEKGSMSLVLVDHKDFAKQKDFIGTVFKAPARNFRRSK
jgi:hypothetical protein